jgi:DNA-binding protein HU-alpha
MRKPELAAQIADSTDLSKEKAADVLNTILEQIAGAVSREDAVNLVGFGSFTPKNRAARKGKNPKTGEVIDIPASSTVAFKPGKALKDSINS